MSKYLVILKMYINDTIEPTHNFHCQTYESTHLLDLIKEIARDNQGLKYDVVQITLIS